MHIYICKSSKLQKVLETELIVLLDQSKAISSSSLLVPSSSLSSFQSFLCHHQQLYKLHASCSNIKAYKLLPVHLTRYASNRTVKLCWCLGRLCNDYPSTTSAAAESSTVLGVRSRREKFFLQIIVIIVLMLTRL
ncbi:unnamed protein product [Enterobius vermicularis]|uniref:Ovule protein n=1 Tax=Enterobius vermicularis TaxID=51028 RepID=A0A0N4VP14_ENTVE|nr:unnamed protein product [Enterobius vermicularis]